MTSDGLREGDRVPLRALLFEDNRDDIEMALRSLRLAGFEPIADVAVTLQELEERLRASLYDIILSDYRMPNATGMEAFEVSRAHAADVPFVLVTGSLGDENAVECLKQGVSDYVLKDRLVRLPVAVKRAIEERRLREDRARAEEALRRSEEQLRLRNQELEEQNRRVEAASRMKSEFLANMSHELRSPLNCIIGFGEIIYDGKLGPLTRLQKDGLKRILDGAGHLLQLVNSLLDLSRIEAGKLELNPEPISVPRLVAEACDALSAIAASKHIQIERRIASRLDAVLDAGRLKQILYNYLSNALKFTPDGGHVAVELTPEESDAFRVAVTDTGPGISTEDQALLFTIFQQLDSGKAKRFQGTGLELSLTKRIVEAQGGKVGVRSEVGKGSTFFAILPRRLERGNGDEPRTNSHSRR